MHTVTISASTPEVINIADVSTYATTILTRNDATGMDACRGCNAGYSGKVVCADSFYCKHTQMRIYQCHRISQNKAKYCGKRINQNPACIKRSAHREHNIKQSNPQTTRNPKPLSRNNTLYHWISDGSKQHTYGYGDSEN